MATNNDRRNDTRQDPDQLKSLFKIMHATRSLAGQVTFWVSILGALVLMGSSSSLLQLPALAGISAVGLNLISNLMQDVAKDRKNEKEIKATVLKAIEESHIIEVLDNSESQIALARLVREQRHLRYAIQFGSKAVASTLTEQYKTNEVFLNELREDLLSVAVELKEGQQEIINGQSEAISILHNIQELVQVKMGASRVDQTKDQRDGFYRHIRLPENFIPRDEIIDRIADLLLTSHTPPPGQSSKSIVLHGMGGLGKSVLVRALCDDIRIQDRFADGILWVTLGQQPNIRAKLVEWIVSLGSGISSSENSDDLLIEKLVTLLENRSCLLVIDDVWESEVLSKFLVGGKKCKHIITTRKSIIARKINASSIKMPGFSENEALNLLTQWAGSTGNDISIQMKRQIVNKLQLLPLAIKLAGARLQEISPQKWLTEFDKLSDLDFGYEPTSPQDSLVVCFKLSLIGLNDKLQNLFLSLAIFPEDTPIPINPIFVLWNETAGVRREDAEKIISELHSNALLEAVSDTRGHNAVYMHDLVRMFAKERLGQKYLETLRLLLSGYRKQQSGNGWHTVPDDGYLFDHLVKHLLETGAIEDALALFKDQGWFESRLAQNGYSYAAYINDIDLVLENLRENNLNLSRNGQKLERIALFMKLVAIKTSLNSVASNYPPEFIGRAHELGLWSPERIMSVIRQIPTVARKFRACVILMNMKNLAPNMRAELQQIAIGLLEVLDEGNASRSLSRSQAINDLLPLLAAEYPEPIIESIFRLTQKDDQVNILRNIFPLLSTELQQLVISRIQTVESKFDRCRLLNAVDATLLVTVDFSEEVDAILRENDESEVTHAIGQVAPYLNEEQAEQIYYRIRSFENRDGYFRALSLIGPLLDRVDFEPDLAEINSIEPPFQRIHVLSSIITHIDERRQEAILSPIVDEFFVMPAVGSVELYPEFLRRFSPYLSDALVERISSIVLEKKSDWLYSFTLEYLGGRISSLTFRQLLVEVLKGSGHSIARAIRATRDLLDSDLKKLVVKEVLRVSDERYRSECILAIIPILPDKEEHLVLAALENIQDLSLGIEGLSVILPKLGAKRREEVLGKAVGRALNMSGPQMEQGLIPLIPYLDPTMFFRVQSHLVRVMGDLLEYIEAESALLQIGNVQGLPISSEMLEMARSLEKDDDKASALQAIAPILEKSLLPQAITTACEIKEELYRLQTFDSYLPRLEMNELEIILNNILDQSSADRKAEFLPHLAKRLVGENRKSAIEMAVVSFDEMEDVSLMGISAGEISQHYQGQEQTQFLRRALNKIQVQKQDSIQRYALSHLACAMDGQDRRDLVSQLIRYMTEHVTDTGNTDCLEILVPILTEDELRVIREIVMSGRQNWGKAEMIILLLSRSDEATRKEAIDEVLQIARKFHKATFLRNKYLHDLVSAVSAEQRDRLLEDGIQAARELPGDSQQLMALYAYTKYHRDPASLTSETRVLFTEQLFKLRDTNRSDFLKFCARVSPLFGKATSEAMSKELRDVYVEWKWY